MAHVVRMNVTYREIGAGVSSRAAGGVWGVCFCVHSSVNLH
jgi:hypothetical protein